MSELRCRPLAMLMLVAFLAGCMSWRPTTLSPAQGVEEEAPSFVRVTKVDGERVVLGSPEMSAESLIGLVSMRPGSPENFTDAARIVIPMSEVVGVEVKESDSQLTAFAVTMGLVGLSGAFLLMLRQVAEANR